ncbi:MAG: DUF1700 domain-containing protein [Lachnospiraceae bacterium]|nr:DUF1700 domain-containing protein [Lachnospiraceae bacterium]
MEKGKEGFLRGLRAALSGEVPPEAVRSHLQYYDGYIRSEIEKGRTEYQVVEELGDARLIAKSIIDATPGGGQGAYEEYGGSYREQETGSRQEGQGPGFYFRRWYGKALLLAAVAMALALALMVIGGFLALIIPFIPFAILIIFVIWIFEKMSRQ